MSKSRRKLAAILSADVVGFSRLMEDDETATVESLQDCRRVFTERIARGHGRVVDMVGDALLAEFGSAVDAVACAAEIQAELGRWNEEQSEHRRMRCRIGVNLGDVLDDGRALYGDGVNVAARLEALAEPGGVCISGKVFDEIDGKLALSFESLGERQVKNIRSKVRVYRHVPAPPLSVRLLGEIELARGGRRVDLPPSKKTRALLAYLVVTQRPQRRDRLCNLLWDVADDPRAALRWSLSKLRPLVDEPGAPRLVTDGTSVAFAPGGARIDVFTARAQAADGFASQDVAALERLAAEFRGPFLEGLELPDFLEFQSWCVSVREEMRTLHGRCLTALLERLADAPEAALPYARTLVQVEPFFEAAHATLVRLLAACGRSREAEQHAHTAGRMLREVGAGDGEALLRAWREVGGRTAEAAPAPATAPPLAAPPRDAPSARELVGRDAERDRIGAAVDLVTTERRLRIVLLLGEPGIGKTRLLAELAADVLRRDGSVLDGAAYEAEIGRPYGPWIDALRRVPAATIGEALRRDLAPLLPEFDQEGAAGGSRDKLFGAVVELLAARAHSAPPVLLSIDDVQWCDDASSELLHYVVRMLRHRPLLVALAARDGELQDNAAMLRVLRSLRRDAAVEELELAPLDPAATARLVAGVAPEGELGRVFAESAGNPLFALEVARSLPHRVGNVPATLRRLVRDRIEQLPAEAAELLRWGAVIGHSIDLRRLQAVSTLDPERLVAVLEVLERHALLRAAPSVAPTPAGYAFAHDVVRQVVYAELSEPRRRLMHHRVARALQEGGEPADAVAAELASHAALAGDADTAVRACLAAARRCVRLFAAAEADALTRRGLLLAQQLGEPDRVKLELELAEVRYAAHRPRRSEEAAREVEAMAQRALALGCTEHARLGLHLSSFLRWERGDWSDARQHILHAEEISRTSDGRDRVVALAEAARCLTLLERDLAQAEALVHEARALSQRTHVEPEAMPSAIGMLALHQGRLDEAAQQFARARELCQAEEDRLGEFRALEHLCILALQRDRMDEASELAAELVALAGRLGEGSEAPQARVLAALCRYADDEAAATELDGALDALRDADAKQRLGYALSRASAIAARRGDAALARARAEEALELARVLERPSDVVLARVALARAAQLAGDQALAERQRAALSVNVLAGVSAEARAAADGWCTTTRPERQGRSRT